MSLCTKSTCRLVKELTAKQQPQGNVPHEDLHQKITDNIMKDLFGRKEEVMARPEVPPQLPQPQPLNMNPPMSSVNDDLRMLFSLPGVMNGPAPPPGLSGPMGMNIPGMPMPGPMLPPPHMPFHLPMNPPMPQPGPGQRAQMTSSSGSTMISPLLPSGPTNPPGPPLSQQGPQRQQLVSSGSVMPPMSGSQPPMNAPTAAVSSTQPSFQPPPGLDMKALPAPSQSTQQSTAQKNPASESSTVTTQPSKKPERPQPVLPVETGATVQDGQAKQPTTPVVNQKTKPLTQPLFFSPQNAAKTLGTAVSAVSAVPATNTNSSAPKAASLTKLQLQQMLTKLVQDPKFIDLVYTEYLATLPPK